MPVSSTLDSDHGVLTPSGSLTYTDALEFKKEFTALLDGGARHVDIALHALDFMDSAGFALLVMTRKECQRRDMTLTLRKPYGQVAEVLRITGAYSAFDIEE